jgi:hypothetical protein
MHCHRCEAKLREVLPNARWARHWICDECDLAYHMVYEKKKKQLFWFLVLGRVPQNSAT